MRCKSSRSLRSKKEELESHSRRDTLKIPKETQCVVLLIPITLQ